MTIVGWPEKGLAVISAASTQPGLADDELSEVLRRLLEAMRIEGRGHVMSVPLSSSFTYHRIDAEGVRINCALGGNGPPVLLLHGYPQTHLIWHHVAPKLATDYTVVLADLRGYGDSDKPRPSADNGEYAKRAMARDQLHVMRVGL
jgi:pimeloyl-ACP methyl ester carboxylesterase